MFCLVSLEKYIYIQNEDRINKILGYHQDFGCSQLKKKKKLSDLYIAD